MEHIKSVDPDDSWPPVYGYWLRFRGMLSVFGIDSLIVAALWTFVQNSYGVAAVIAGVSAITAQYIVRQWYLTKNRTENALHSLCHKTRDDVAELTNLGTGGVARVKLIEFNRQTSQRVASIFRAAKRDSTVGCCIRLARHDSDGRPVYATVGRSDNFDPSRERNSVPIAANAGIARVLMERDTQGVVIVRSINDAIEKGWWLGCPNDTLPDIRTVMVCPINGWSGKTKMLLGILYVTSKIDNFAATDTTLLKVVADHLGMVYGQLFSSFSEQMLAPQKSRG